MSVRRLAVVAAAALLPLSLLTGVSHATPPRTGDQTCHFAATEDPGAAEALSGVIDGGPVLSNGALTCRMLVGGGTHAHPTSGTALTAYGSNGITYLSPTAVSFNVPEFSEVYLCTSFLSDGARYYWDAPNRVWTTNATSGCELALVVTAENAAFAPVPREYFPKGTIEISFTPGTGTLVGYTHFDPPLVGWTCTAALLSSARSVSCTPPRPARGFRNVCSALTVEATNVLGLVTGSSRCAGGGDARATAGIPAVVTAAVDTPFSTFAWTCSAAADSTAVGPWKVRCSVGS